MIPSLVIVEEYLFDVMLEFSSFDIFLRFHFLYIIIIFILIKLWGYGVVVSYNQGRQWRRCSVVGS